jgi:SRSO17 transposase
MGEAHPDGLEYLLFGADWDADAVGRQLRAEVVRHMGYEPGTGVIDESGFVKKGECSAGVKRQYCGRVGKIENCQVGVYLGYIAAQGHALIDRELYLPQSWYDEPVRLARPSNRQATTDEAQGMPASGVEAAAVKSFGGLPSSFLPPD